jgi:superfamily II DNA/RNA helicase
VPLVIHFDPPADATDYVHRSGRTGRAGADGTVVTLVGTEHVAATKLIQRTLGLPSGVSLPDVSALSSPESGRGPSTAAEAVPSPAAATRTRRPERRSETSASNRPPRLRNRGPSPARAGQR